MEVLEVEVYAAVGESLDGQFAGGLIPAGAAAVVAVLPVVAELERVASATRVGVEEVGVADVGGRVGHDGAGVRSRAGAARASVPDADRVR